MEGRRAVVEPAIHVEPVLLGRIHRLFGVGREPSAEGVGQGLLDSLSVGLDLDPVVLAVGLRSALRFLPLCGLAPLLLGLCLIVVEAVTEEFAHVVVGHGCVRHCFLQCLIDRLDEVLHLIEPGHDAFALANQVADLVALVQQARDLVKRQLEPAVNDDLGQARQVRRGVNPIPRGGTPTRGQQPNFVIVVKRPDRDAKSLRDFAHGEFVHLHLLRHVDHAGASRRVRVKSSCSKLFERRGSPVRCPRATHSS